MAARTAIAHEDESALLGDDPEERVKHEPEQIGENIFAMCMVSFIRDYVGLCNGTDLKIQRSVRMIYSILLVSGCLFLQFFLLRAVYGLLCVSAVNKIREDYSKYQLTMYGKDHVFVNQNGFYRGTDEKYLDASRFHGFETDMKHAICQIPLAHVQYTFAILLIWTLTCIADLRKSIDQVFGLLVYTPTVATASEVLESMDDDNEQFLVKGLTFTLKILLAVLCLIPRVVAVLILNFLGCRWLLATNSLNDLLLNALALEFMLVLKDLLYETLASKRSKFITENTFILAHPPEQVTITSVLGSGVWFLVGVTWVYLYMFHLQQVLPGYRWDVVGVCRTWKGAVHMR